MKLTILIIICALGLVLPLFWLFGTITGIVSYCLHWKRTAPQEGAVAFNHHLGLTMADGGESITKEEEK